MTTEETGPELTYGQKQVGLTFNPGKNEAVHQIKLKAAELIDEINDQRSMAMSAGRSGEILAQYALGIRHAEDACDRAVKAATWQY